MWTGKIAQVAGGEGRGDDVCEGESGGFVIILESCVMGERIGTGENVV